jgi:hypothetical protein
MTYNVFTYDKYDGCEHVLGDCDEQELRTFLSKYTGYLHRLTIIEGKLLDTDTLIEQLGFLRYRGKIQK